ncbi:MAG: type II toxin-antitoxin system RelE/ParE family toxin [Oscillospiraceae bacterium]|nr:type II toxin-antitoxin system RelE/ParE family toxin [Oscillospiraceae bacterium]
MTYEVIVSEPAKIDLKEIAAYICDLHAPQAAYNQICRIEKRIYSLDFMPERYRLYDGEAFQGSGLRMVPVDNFCIFYHIDNESEIVEISRVVYGRRNMDTLDIDIHWGEQLNDNT